MKDIATKLKEIIKEIFSVEIEPTVTEAPEGTGADFASNVAFVLSKELRQNPREIAGEICERINADGEIKCEVAGGGFVNFISPDEYFVNIVDKMSEGKKFEVNISQDEYCHKKVVCEFSDPNPFKVLHVGHLYTSIVGDSIARLIENAGGEVVRANFGGDVGLHVAKTIYALTVHSGGFLRQRMRDSLSVPLSTVRSVAPASFNSIQTEQSFSERSFVDSFDNSASLNMVHSEQSSSAPEQPLNDWFFDEFVKNLTIEDIAKAYVEGTRSYEEDEEAKAEITKLNKEIYKINKEKETESEIAKIYWKGRELSYKYFEEFYKNIGVKFDKYYPESTVAERGLATIKEHTPEVYEESDGAIVFDGEKYGLHTRVFVNKEGLPTYEAKDVGLLFTKNDDYHFDESIVITGNDIIDYMKVVLKSVSMYAPELVEKTTHITHGNVRLPGNEKMSSRKGNFIKAVDILNAVREKTTDEKIAMAAIKYGFLRYKIGNNIEFNIDDCVSMAGNSGPYLLYSAVRAGKILEKCGEAEENPEYKMNEYEKKLAKKMGNFASVIKEATEGKAPHLICNYLYEMSQDFSRFYENSRVAGSEFEGNRKKIVKAYKNIITKGLNLLGIEVPDEM